MLASQALPHSLGLLYEDLTEHLGFLRSSDEYKVMAMASYGRPRFAQELEQYIHATGDGGFRTAGRPMVDDPRDALECFGSAPVDLLAIGPFVVRRPRPTPR